MDRSLRFAHKLDLGWGLLRRRVPSTNSSPTEEALFVDTPTIRVCNYNLHRRRVLLPLRFALRDVILKKSSSMFKEITHEINVNLHESDIIWKGCQAKHISNGLSELWSEIRPSIVRLCFIASGWRCSLKCLTRCHPCHFAFAVPTWRVSAPILTGYGNNISLSVAIKDGRRHKLLLYCHSIFELVSSLPLAGCLATGPHVERMQHHLRADLVIVHHTAHQQY